MRKDLERKLKRERVEACLNCRRFERCDSVGKFEECVDFEEVEGEAWAIERFSACGSSMKETPNEKRNSNDD